MDIAREPSRLSVGITGHRLNRVTASQLDQLTPALYGLLSLMASLAADEGKLWICSALAEGADQHLAQIALGAGWSLHALLPFDVNHCEADAPSPAGRVGFCSLIDRADRITRLPGEGSPTPQGYLQLAGAIVDCSDVLIAVWDGGAAHGPGGTAEVVELALRKQKPVIHFKPGGDREPMLLWRGRLLPLNPQTPGARRRLAEVLHRVRYNVA